MTGVLDPAAVPGRPRDPSPGPGLNPRVVRVSRGEATAEDRIVFEVELADTGALPEDASLAVEACGPRPCDRRVTVRRAGLEEAAREHPGAARLREALEAHERLRRSWRIRGGVLELRRDRPLLMGVLNVTPDSFSDGGRFLDPADAVARGEEMVRSGAAILDLGGESTRPGSAPVPLAEELERVLPVVEGLARRVDVPLSVDTTKAAVARAALDLGASIINDTSAMADDPDMPAAVAEAGAGVILMHRKGRPRTMQDDPHYDHCRAEVAAALREAIDRAERQGVPRDALAIDPGLGFGKRLQDNLDLVGRLGELRSLDRPLVLGASRKSFLGQLTGRAATEREAATLATTAVAFREGAEILRVHDVASSRDVLCVVAALER